MNDHFTAFAMLHASISKTLGALRDFTREKRHKPIFERAGFQDLITPFEQMGLELQQRLDTVSDVYTFLVGVPTPTPRFFLTLFQEHFEITNGRAEMGRTTSPDLFLKHLLHILPRVEPTLVQINSSDCAPYLHKMPRMSSALTRVCTWLLPTATTFSCSE